jgi:hypothetical protein
MAAPLLAQLASAQHTAPVTQVPPQHTPPAQSLASGFAGLEQRPVAGSQVPGSWHSSRAVQTVAVPPPQEPFGWQIVPVVQALRSSQVWPTRIGLPQTPSTQAACRH